LTALKDSYRAHALAHAACQPIANEVTPAAESPASARDSNIEN